MKIIDILNKIANGEEPPKKIKYKGVIWLYENNTYLRKDLAPNFDDSYRKYLLGFYNYGILNNEVEIIEEKEIPEKEDELIRYNIQDFDNLKEFVEITTNDLFGKVNKVIDKLNGVIDYFKNKGE